MISNEVAEDVSTIMRQDCQLSHMLTEDEDPYAPFKAIVRAHEINLGVALTPLYTGTDSFISDDVAASIAAIIRDDVELTEMLHTSDEGQDAPVQAVVEAYERHRVTAEALNG